MTRDIISINDFIVLIEQSLPHDDTIELCSFDEDIIGISFYGSGDVQLTTTFHNQQQVHVHTRGMCLSFFSGSRVRFMHTVKPHSPLKCVVICCSVKNIQKLPAEEREIFETHLPQLLAARGDFTPGPSFLMNGSMMQAVDKIFDTPYAGATRVMFLRSQVTELLSHFFALLTQKQPEQVLNEELQKLLQAKDILTRNMDAPPSLNELSRLIGLNSYKLKKNFKEMFGMPVFKFLQNERLERAHQLLSNGNLPIQETAWMVGYESISSFSNAFTKKYGFRPSEIKATSVSNKT